VTLTRKALIAVAVLIALVVVLGSVYITMEVLQVLPSDSFMDD
jgi:predicted membrane protein